MNKRNASLAIMASCLALGFAAYAGSKESHPIQFDLQSRTASGSLADVRAESDPGAYINCLATSYLGFPQLVLTCFAHSGKEFLTCSTSEPQFLQQFSSINDSSWIRFTANEEGYCVVMQVRNGSPYTPKQL